MNQSSDTGQPIPPADRNNNFNLLRLVFATLVILSHSPEFVDGNSHRELLMRTFHTITFGILAVHGFFLLSGYLIVQSWQRSPGPWAFLAKRCLRIYPAFIVATILCVLLVGPLGAHGFSSPDYFAKLKFWPFLKNLLVLDEPGTPPVFAGQHYAAVNGAMWSIAYEFRCYLLVLLFGVCGLLRRRRFWLAFFIVSAALGFLFPKYINHRTFYGVEVSFEDSGHFFRLLTYFTAGGCFYLFRDRVKYRLVPVVLCAALVLVFLCSYTTVHFGLATFGGYLLFGLAFARLPWAGEFRKLPDISYGVYLYGWPIQKLWLWYFPSMSPWTLFPLALAGSCVMGWLSWHWVEAPFLRMKPRGPESPSAPTGFCRAKDPQLPAVR